MSSAILADARRRIASSSALSPASSPSSVDCTSPRSIAAIGMLEAGPRGLVDEPVDASRGVLPDWPTASNRDSAAATVFWSSAAWIAFLSSDASA